MNPAIAYLSLWQVIGGNLAKFAMAAASLARHDHPIVADILDIVNSDTGWQLSEGARVKAACRFIDDDCGTTVGSRLPCLISAIVSMPVMHMMHHLLKIESIAHKHPETKRQVGSFTRNDHAIARPTDDELSHSVAMEVASCRCVHDCLHQGVQVIDYSFLIRSTRRGARNRNS